MYFYVHDIKLLCVRTIYFKPFKIGLEIKTNSHRSTCYLNSTNSIVSSIPFLSIIHTPPSFPPFQIYHMVFSVPSICCSLSMKSKTINQ